MLLHLNIVYYSTVIVVEKKQKGRAMYDWVTGVHPGMHHQDLHRHPPEAANALSRCASAQSQPRLSECKQLIWQKKSNILWHVFNFGKYFGRMSFSPNRFILILNLQAWYPLPSAQITYSIKRMLQTMQAFTVIFALWLDTRLKPGLHFDSIFSWNIQSGGHHCATLHCPEKYYWIYCSTM